MSEHLPKDIRPPRTIDELLAINLVTARNAVGWTQEALSAVSRISRATIAQLETGNSDPRLSTIAALASSLGVPTSFLIVGPVEVRALAGLGEQLESSPPRLLPGDARLLQEWVESGTARERTEIVRFAMSRVDATAAEATLSPILASIFTTFLPDPGLAIGAALGELISRATADPKG